MEDLLAKRSPFLTIWTHPRKTLRALLEWHRSTPMVLLLAVLAGITQVYNNRVGQSETAIGSHAVEWIFILVGGAIGGLLGLLIGTFIVYHIGRWLGGQGDKTAIRYALSWSYVPAIFSLLLIPVDYWVFGKDLFLLGATPVSHSVLLILVQWLSLLASFVLGIWSFVLMVGCLAEAHQYSYGRALLTLFLPAIVIGGIAIVVAIIAFVA